MKSRGMYETPGGTIYHAAHRAIEQLTLDRGAAHLKDELMPRYAELIYNGLWFSPEREMLQAAIDHSQAKVDGTVRLKLYKGGVHITGRKSPNSLYSEKVVTFEDDAGAYDQRDAEGFIKLNALAAAPARQARPRLIDAPHLPKPRRRAPRAPRPWWEGAAVRRRDDPAGRSVPLLYPPIPPLVDLVGHMGRYQVQLDLANSPDPPAMVLASTGLPIGNLGVDLLVVPLAKLIGLELAVKLIVMSIPPMTVAGLLWVAREVHNRLPPTVAFALPLRLRPSVHVRLRQFRAVDGAGLPRVRAVAAARPARQVEAARDPVRADLLIVFFAHTFGWGTLGLLCFSAEAVRQHDRGRSWWIGDHRAALSRLA